MSISQNNVNNVVNFLVPAAGQTHCVGVKGAPFATSPYIIDWRQFNVDNFPFMPQGVYIDNTQSQSSVDVVIGPIGYTITCPAGASLMVPFPAPNGQTASITSASQPTDVTSIYFVDYPVIPFIQSAPNVSGSTPVIIEGINTTDVLSTQMGPLAVGNLPYTVIEKPNAGTVNHLSIAAGATTATLAAPAGTSLRRLSLALSGATLGAAANVTLTATLNGVTVYTTNVYVGATASNGSLSYDFDFSAAPITSAGNFVITLGTALTTGIVDGNALFG